MVRAALVHDPPSLPQDAPPTAAAAAASSDQPLPPRPGDKHLEEHQGLLEPRQPRSWVRNAGGAGGLALQGPSTWQASAAAQWLQHHRRFATTALVSLARIFERVDEALLPAVYLYVGCAFNATPTQLGAITFARALVQASKCAPPPPPPPPIRLPSAVGAAAAAAGASLHCCSAEPAATRNAPA